jgi:putative lumazine-binding protein
MRILFLLVLALGSSSAQGPAPSATAPDADAIRATALDYIDGFYTSDAARMEKALHPELAKRTVTTDPNTGKSKLRQQSALALVQATRGGAGRKYQEARRQHDVFILDRFQDTAMVKVVAADWVDYLQMAKCDGHWKIINVLWVLKPAIQRPSAERPAPKGFPDHGDGRPDRIDSKDRVDKGY